MGVEATRQGRTQPREVSSVQLGEWVYRICKRSLDLMVSIAFLILVAPLMAVIALAIRLDSPGPVIFRQRRVGKDRQEFTFYKFRSMFHEADNDVHEEYVKAFINGHGSGAASGEEVIHKMIYDERITRVGGLLRRSSLDELPQLINVLKGEMSLVGPRPPIPYEVAEYEDWHQRRLEVLPGITGLWQVRGRSRVSFDEMVQLDLKYIEKRSFWLDLRILAETPWVVLTGKGAW